MSEKTLQPIALTVEIRWGCTAATACAAQLNSWGRSCLHKCAAVACSTSSWQSKVRPKWRPSAPMENAAAKRFAGLHNQAPKTTREVGNRPRIPAACAQGCEAEPPADRRARRSDAAHRCSPHCIAPGWIRRIPDVQQVLERLEHLFPRATPWRNRERCHPFPKPQRTCRTVRLAGRSADALKRAPHRLAKYPHGSVRLQAGLASDLSEKLWT
mmetsp:Transcript_125474/g.360647  ORF Transcript_125474/g.360647 Transcript_125474/m.360647 type:complete len:213 (-) Transcript_125474:1038-1676(-)